ncbi:outer membrane protein OmpA-like peptidoglycan-associated protein [Cupriavidus agavae]|uniref:Outer membrane protein OmpA-like peptidoglycan-associated protein n=2 Tax=Cupriavidus agavae TaxID=1001822 RepID=A0A4Q7RCH7_9BURK|nr:outer membrane protein OmpA-like peptidoglycan-associated protein [Cupriavidus agavae]
MLAWMAALSLGWLALSSPLDTTWNWLFAGCVVTAVAVAIVLVGRRARARRDAAAAVLAAIDASLAALPGDIRSNTALVLVLGDSPDTLTRAFGDAVVRITDAAIWVRIDASDRLAEVAAVLKQWRLGQGPEAVACLVSADQAEVSSTVSPAPSPALSPAMATTLWQWRSTIGAASRAVGYPLPACLAIQTAEADGPSDDCPWFQIATTPQGGDMLDALALQLASYAAQVQPADRAARMYRGARLAALARWTIDTVLPALQQDQPDRRHAGPPLSLWACAVIATAGAPVAGSRLTMYVTRQTSLAPQTRDGRRAAFPLPDALARGLAVRHAQSVLPRALAHGFAWLCVAFCAAAAASAWQNRALVARVMADMAHYETLTVERDAARRDALAVLRRDREELDRHARNGVPVRLALGFYRGGTLREPLARLIDGYQPPPPPPATIELDSLSLFRSGSATLNPGSNRVLIGALDMIKAHPDKRVLVAGHTDSTGNAQANVRLSEARAASVRDWLADAAALPLTHFAVQGYGATRPKASNDTVAGRAANRRVEITLVPDCRDARGGDPATPGHPACSFPSKE